MEQWCREQFATGTGLPGDSLIEGVVCELMLNDEMSGRESSRSAGSEKAMNLVY